MPGNVKARPDEIVLARGQLTARVFSGPPEATLRGTSRRPGERCAEATPLANRVVRNMHDRDDGTQYGVATALLLGAEFLHCLHELVDTVSIGG
jgi:hypothetical protein